MCDPTIGAAKKSGWTPASRKVWISSSLNMHIFSQLRQGRHRSRACLPRPMLDAIRFVANEAQDISRVPELERRDSITCIGKNRVGLAERTHLVITVLLPVSKRQADSLAHIVLPYRGTVPIRPNSWEESPEASYPFDGAWQALRAPTTSSPPPALAFPGKVNTAVRCQEEFTVKSPASA